MAQHLLAGMRREHIHTRNSNPSLPVRRTSEVLPSRHHHHHHDD